MRRSICLSLLILFTMLGCSISGIGSSAKGDSPAGGSETGADQEATRIAHSVQQTVAALSTTTPVSGTQSVRISVSVETNCRTGPGNAYEVVGFLPVGQEAEVIARNAASDFWIIRLPSNLEVNCWVWGQYASLNGSTEDLPVYTPPPTPTATQTTQGPAPASQPSVTIVNNGTKVIFYLYISLTSSSSWGDDRLGSATISSGGSFTTLLAPGEYDIKIEDSSHNVLKTWFSTTVNGPVTLTYTP